MIISVDINKMNNSYKELKIIWDDYISGQNKNIRDRIINLLSMQKIKIRQDDGELKQINISIPTAIKDSFVIGLRYIKKDGTFTEDHFLCREAKELNSGIKGIKPYYKRKLEDKLPEYKDTHKNQISSNQDLIKFYRNSNSGDITHVNTISYFMNSD